MGADPYREPRLDAAEVRRVLKRAVELAEHDPAIASAERTLSRAELERGAANLGIPTSSVAHALASEGVQASEAGRSWFIGAPTRILFEREVAGEPSEADREDLLEELRIALGDTGTTESVGQTLIWKLTPQYGGKGRDLSVRLRWREGRTRI